MPTNKHASFRYRTLNGCFSNRGHRKWTLEELVQHVSHHLQEDFGSDITVSQRTIQGDINIMRSAKPRGFDAPIVCEAGYYFYSDPTYTIEKSALSKDELDILRSAIGLLRLLPGLPQLPALQMLLKRVDVGNNLNTLSSTSIQFESNLYVHGLEWLGTIYKSIIEQQVLQIAYHPFTKDPLEILLHPYLLKEWRNRWYIFGRNSQDQLWNLALDRIQKIKIAEQVAYIENDLFDPETWFNDIIGVTKPDNAQPVEVQFETSYLSSRYIETRPIHASQHLVHQENDRYRFSLTVILNQELVNELVRYGNDLSVIKPTSLKESVEKIVGPR